MRVAEKCWLLGAPAAPYWESSRAASRLDQRAEGCHGRPLGCSRVSAALCAWCPNKETLWKSPESVEETGRGTVWKDGIKRLHLVRYRYYKVLIGDKKDLLDMRKSKYQRWKEYSDRLLK